MLTDLDGVARPDGGSVVCTNGHLHDEVLRTFGTDRAADLTDLSERSRHATTWPGPEMRYIVDTGTTGAGRPLAG